MNALVPIIMDEILKNQPKHESPDVMSEILGEYPLSGMMAVEIKSGDQTASSGIYEGKVTDFPAQFVYDKVTTEQSKEANTYYFRYYINLSQYPGYDTCFIGSMQGFYDGVVQFSKDSSNKWSAFLPDVFMSVPKA